MATYELQLVRVKVSDADPLPFRRPDQVVDYLQKNKCFTTEDFWREQCWMIALGKGSIPIGHFRVSSGSPDKCLIDAGLIARVALMVGAVGVVVSHNHPGGDSKPTVRDIDETKKLNNALGALSIGLVDHVIVSADEYFSFKDEIVKKFKGLF